MPLFYTHPFQFYANLIQIYVNLLGSLSNHDGVGNESVKKQQALMSKTMTLHVRHTFWYISFPSSAKQQREMTSFKVFWRTRHTMVNFSFSS